MIEIFKVHPSLNSHILFYSNGLPLWHGLPDIRHIKVNYGRVLAILNLIELKFLRSYPYMKAHIVLWYWSSYLARFVRYYGR